MDPEFSRLIDAAESIATSGRWDAVIARIKELAAHTGPDNAWHVQVIASLCSHVFSEYLLLKRAHGTDPQDDSSLLAWRARNLLELSVWSMYCTQTRENAHRFYEDAGRDVIGIFKAFTKWGTPRMSTEWIGSIEQSKIDLSQRAEAEGIASLDGPYKSVSDAAVECGIGDQFAVSYKLLSKFAHPTAMRVLAGPDDAKNALQRDWFFSQGCLFFAGAFEYLEPQLIGLTRW
jgi:hypothetical protein